MKVPFNVLIFYIILIGFLILNTTFLGNFYLVNIFLKILYENTMSFFIISVPHHALYSYHTTPNFMSSSYIV